MSQSATASPERAKRVEEPTASPPPPSPASRVFNEAAMGFLALVAFAVALGPLVFDLSPAADRALQGVEWALVAIFALDFAVQAATAEDRRAWIRSPWRLVDAVTILGPLAALLPGISDAASGSLALRLLRVGRAVALGTRAGGAAAGKRRGPGQTAVAEAPEVKRVPAGAALDAAASDWGACLAWSRDPGPAWFHVARLAAPQFHEVARAAGADAQDVDNVFQPDAPARLRNSANGRAATVFAWLPTVAPEGFPAVTRTRVALVLAERGLLTATPANFDLPGHLARLTVRSPLPDTLPFPARITLGLLALARDRFQFTAQRFDEEVRRYDSATEGGQAFLQETFHLRRVISATALDLASLRAIARALADGRAKLRGLDLSQDKFVDDLANDCDRLHDLLGSLKEDVQSVIELHINVKSFEMNKFLKLLAIVSFLGLIPSVAGGMLGMNVAGNPWNVTLGQVAFGVGMTAGTALYVFAVKGWLR